MYDSCLGFKGSDIRKMLEEIERLQLDAQQWKTAFTEECRVNDKLRAAHEPSAARRLIAEVAAISSADEVDGCIEAAKKLLSAQPPLSSDHLTERASWSRLCHKHEQEIARLRETLLRIADADFRYSSDDDEDTQLSLRIADARAALNRAPAQPPGDDAPEISVDDIERATWRIGGKVVSAEEGKAAMRAALTKRSGRCPHGYELANLADGTDTCAGCESTKGVQP